LVEIVVLPPYATKDGPPGENHSSALLGEESPEITGEYP